MCEWMNGRGTHFCLLTLHSLKRVWRLQWFQHLPSKWEHNVILCHDILLQLYINIYWSISLLDLSVMTYFWWISWHEISQDPICDNILPKHFAVFTFTFTFTFTFSRRFYPKRLTLHSSYSFYILSALAFPGNRTHDLGVANAMLYQLSYRKAVAHIRAAPLIVTIFASNTHAIFFLNDNDSAMSIAMVFTWRVSVEREKTWEACFSAAPLIVKKLRSWFKHPRNLFP